MDALNPVTVDTLKRMKEEGKKIAMITAYDFPSAKLAEQAGADLILVGDSLGMVVLGYGSTLPVTVEEMLHHTKAVTRAVRRSLVVADLPFLSYHGSWDRTLANAGRLIQEGGAKAVKLEGGREVAETIHKLTLAGIPVMGHLGLTPQSVNRLGGYKVQGKDAETALRLLEDARILEQAGCFAVVLECIPAPLAARIAGALSIPAIGIGAGGGTDGQVLVYHDLLGYGVGRTPKFVKQYARIGEAIEEAIRNYVEEVRAGRFPSAEHAYKMDERVLQALDGEGEGR